MEGLGRLDLVLVVGQAGFQRGGEQHFQVAAAGIRVAVLGGNHFALFRQADLAGDGAGRLGQDGVVGRTAAAADRAAAAMEQAQADAVLLEDAGQFDLGLVELPAGSQEAAVLVGIGVAEHDLVLVATAGDQCAISRQPEDAVHGDGAFLQVLDGFEQRDDVDVEARGFTRQQQAGFLEQQGQFEQVGDAVGLRDDAVGQGGGAVFLAQVAGTEEDVELAARFLAVVEIRRVERARGGDFLGQQLNASLF